MPRLFTALELPQMVRTHLSLIRGDLNGAHWIAPDNMHLTLRFAGDVDGDAADAFADALAAIALPPLAIRITGTGVFGGGHPTAVYAAIENSEALQTLQRANERAARAAGLAPPPRSFHPHVTLARLRGTRPASVAKFLEQTGDLRLAPFLVDRFVLLSSRPLTGGGPYVVEEEFELASGPGPGDPAA
jgi:2'-5' RNA ligase